MLHRVDRLPMAPDEQTEVLALHASGQEPIGLLDSNVHIQTQAVDDLLEQLPQDRRRIIALTWNPLGSTHLRLPERFFFLRGGGGGAPPTAAPARAGSPFGPFGASALPFGDALPPPGGAPPLPGKTVGGGPILRRTKYP